MQKNNRSHEKILSIAGFSFFMVPIIFYILQGFFVRYGADDYCFSGLIKQFGFFQGLHEFYNFTSNRFSAFMFVSISEIFGENSIRWISPLIIIFLGFALFRGVHYLTTRYNSEQSKLISVLMTGIILFFTLYLAPNIHQSVYWRSGLTHYFLPLPMVLLLVPAIYSSREFFKPGFIKSLTLFFISLLNAGLSESYAALQLGIFFITAIFLFFDDKAKSRKRKLESIASLIMGTVTAMVVMINSPGNTLRLRTLQQAKDLFSIISISTTSAADFIFYSIKGLWVPFGVLFLINVLIAFNFLNLKEINQHPRTIVFIFLIIAVATFFLIVCVCAPTAYGMMAYPEKRVLMLAQFILICGVSLEGLIIGYSLRDIQGNTSVFKIISLVVLFVLCLYPLSTLDDRLSGLGFYRKRAELWDRRRIAIDQFLDGGQNNLVVTALDSHAEIAELTDDINYWVNQCAANYYEIESISAVEIE